MKQLAIIKGVGFGNRDVGVPVLWFSAYIGDNVAALQILSLAQAVDMIKKYSVYDVRHLEGKPVWVNVSGNTVDYLEPCLINKNEL